MTRRDFGNVRRLESGRFQARYVDRNGRTRTASFDTSDWPSSTWPRRRPT